MIGLFTDWVKFYANIQHFGGYGKKICASNHRTDNDLHKINCSDLACDGKVRNEKEI
jgi:hypothetical protein